MNIDSLRDYLLLAMADGSAAEREARMQALVGRIEAGEVHWGDFFVARDANHQPQAALRLAPIGPNTYQLLPLFTAAERPVEARDVSLLDEAFSETQRRGAAMVSTRPRADRLSAAYRERLTGLGFADLGERHEFKTPVDHLPDDAGTPLSWQTLDVCGLDVATSALARAAIGDPSGLDADEDPRTVILGYAEELGLGSGPEAVAVAFFEGHAVAFICAQVERETGWSRIAYMGVDPDWRGRGFGKWVHRRGFAMLRAQQGVLYHGGTSAKNSAMLALFRRHGCVPFAHLSDWEWRGPTPA